MFKWLRNAAEKKIIQSHLSEMIPWLRKLSSIPDEDVAAIYLSALMFRNIIKRHEGIEFIKTGEAIEQHPMLPDKGTDRLNRATAEKEIAISLTGH